jgi:Bardet-Biedl syndrome 4 protein
MMDENEIENFDEKQRKKLSESKLALNKKDQRGNEIDSLNFLVHQYFIRNEFDSCIEVLSKYSKTKSGFESGYSKIIRGLIARNNGKISESLSLFKDSHSLFKYSSDVSYILKEIGKNFYLLGKFSDSIDIYNNVLHKNKDDWDCYYHIGLIFFNVKKYKKAEEYMNEALKINKCKEVLIAYGKIFLKNNKIEEAIKKFEDVLNISPNDTNLLSILGGLYLKKKDKDKAMKYYNKVLNYDKKYSKSLIGLESIYQNEGDEETSYNLLSIGNSSNPNSAYIWNNLGMWYLSKDKKIFASTCLKRALYLAPFEWTISFNLGLVYLKNEQYVSSFIHMNTAANLNKNNYLIYLYLGIICSELNNDNNAKNCFEKALTIKEDPIAYFNYIIFLIKKNMIKDAENNLQKLIKIFPKNKKGKAEYKLIEAQIPNIKKILNVE